MNFIDFAGGFLAYVVDTAWTAVCLTPSDAGCYVYKGDNLIASDVAWPVAQKLVELFAGV